MFTHSVSAQAGFGASAIEYCYAARGIRVLSMAEAPFCLSLYSVMAYYVFSLSGTEREYACRGWKKRRA